MMIKQLILAFALLMMGASAQEPARSCGPQIPYENHNQVDPRPLTFRELKGRVLSEVGEPAKEIGPVPGACLGLFSEEGHRLITTATANEEGNFQFGSLATGRYRLVVRANGLCVANIPLQIAAPKSGSRKLKNNQLVVHMRPAGIDSCSYADYK